MRLRGKGSGAVRDVWDKAIDCQVASLGMASVVDAAVNAQSRGSDDRVGRTAERVTNGGKGKRNEDK